ncbi:MAG: hypothetical protein CSA70_08970 [Rhodobacterales bacterium]|nr:MAG: hypothetical protein CSA70_08970 [Rhodobacterales bacterium]
MWRLIVVTFGFLGFAFYQMSGGAEYVPAPGSLQAAAIAKKDRAEFEAALQADLEKRLAAERAERQARITLASHAPAAAPTVNTVNTATVTRASLTETVPASIKDTAKRATLTFVAGSADPLTGDTADTAAPVPTKSELPIVSIDNAKVQDLIAASMSSHKTRENAKRLTAAGEDFRKVIKGRVNLRQGPGTTYNVVSKLTQGTEVVILHNDGGGWVKLRTLDEGRVGWMADYLLTAAK